MITNMDGQTGYYMRTSHFLQNIGTQVDKIEKGWVVYRDEGVSGRVNFKDRPSGQRLLEDIRQGKVNQVVVLRIDRLGRDTSDILNTIRYIHQYKVPIRSLNEGINTLDDEGRETPMSNLLLSILSSLSEYQFFQLKEKVQHGIQRCKLEGRYTGRKIGAVEPLDKFLSKPKVKKIKVMLMSGMSVRKISTVMECSPNTVLKVKTVLSNSLQ